MSSRLAPLIIAMALVDSGYTAAAPLDFKPFPQQCAVLEGGPFQFANGMRVVVSNNPSIATLKVASSTVFAAEDSAGVQLTVTRLRDLRRAERRFRSG